ncbi:MAG: inorganic phosphate transporter [Rhodanobacteraceae bacterium]|nr:MAG: inorganic phosphate transporter [Rhodanobacteraceae bacterium]
MQIALLLAVLFLAATNGANDNFKGVATLYGSRRAGYWTSLIWASLTTLAGSVSSAFLAHALLEAFTGAGLVPPAIATETRFAFAVAGGGAITVALAAWRGLPISTTMALVGAMVGAGLIAIGTTVHFASLMNTFLLPLVVSPLIAVVPAMLLAPPLRRWVARHVTTERECVCVTEAVAVTPDGAMLREGSALAVVAGSDSRCRDLNARPVAWWSARRIADVSLFLLGGAVSFARGLNDTPKVAALLLPIAAFAGHDNLAVTLAGVAMLVGGLLGARRVARTLSDKITQLDVGAALAAGLTTSALVCAASFDGLPVSTTQVSVGALAGTGLVGGSKVDRKVLTNIVLSWVITLPVGALLGAVLYAVVR